MRHLPAWQQLLNRIVDEAVEAGVDRKRAVAGIELVADPISLQRAVYRYNTQVWPGGGRCDCPDASYRKAGRRCKHQCALLALQRLQKWLRTPSSAETQERPIYYLEKAGSNIPIPIIG